jgi:hypothetical protein
MLSEKSWNIRGGRVRRYGLSPGGRHSAPFPHLKARTVRQHPLRDAFWRVQVKETGALII